MHKTKFLALALQIGILRNMELRHIRYFIAVAEDENVSRAAQKLHLSQPALSRQVADLEEELGFLLLERTAKSVRLTEAGRVFLREGRAVLDRVDEAVRLARSVAGGGAGELNVGYAPTPTVRLLPATLRAFQTRFPNVRVRLWDLSTEEMLEGVRNGKLQIAMLVRPTDTMLSGLHYEELTSDQMRLAVSPSHALASGNSVTLKQVVEEPLVAYEERNYPEYREYLKALFDGSGKSPRIVQEHDSGTSLFAAVEAGSGVAFLPQSLACVVGARLKLIPITPEPPPLSIGMVWRGKKLENVAAEFLKAAKGCRQKLKS